MLQIQDTAGSCPRCGTKFECRPGDISACYCAGIELSKEEYTYIHTRFKTCLCNACLSTMKQEYARDTSTRNPGKGKMSARLTAVILFFAAFVSAQSYAPPAGQPGSTAIYVDSSVFIAWATGCTVTRGYQDISNPSLGYASVGDGTMGTGKAFSNAVVSLGDGGAAICTFDHPIRNGAGFDFAVFENGFDDTFLEFAFVEVSSDGQNFFRFPSHSQSDTVQQSASFGSTDARKINNLAGKYRGGYGTPFDLQELAGKPGLDIERVTHVKIIDVVGSVNPAYATRDAQGNKINDPWPTAFPSGGFDLDAVGVIYENRITGLKENTITSARIYPNPSNSGEAVHIVTDAEIQYVELADQSGRVVYSGLTAEINTSGLSGGLYLLRVHTSGGLRTAKLLILQAGN